MFLLDNQLITSPSDLTLASKCEFAFLRKLDERHGRIARLEEEDDPLMARTAELGDQHEGRVLDAYRSQYPGGVVAFERPDSTRTALEAQATATLAAFERGESVVYQGTFFDAPSPVAFLGHADFIVRQADGRYRVEDTKLARSAKVAALLQLAAYAEQLARLGVPVDDTVSLLLGHGQPSHHRLEDIAPVYRVRRRRLLELIETRDREGVNGSVVAWGDQRFGICGACTYCEKEIEASGDVLQVANLRRTQRARLAKAGIRTVAELVDCSRKAIEIGIGSTTLDNLRAQAQLQLRPHKDGKPPFEWRDKEALRDLPPSDVGDIFFDFEGDPLYTEGGDQWGLDYLFGVMQADGVFRTFWAHSFAEERQALQDFLAYVVERRKQYPNLHIYHYAAYERTHLASLAARHGVGEDIVDDLFRSHVLVDLYPIVRKALRVGSPSYSIKKLEPLYMGDDLRDETGVTNAGDSIVEYANAVALRESDALGSNASLKKIEDYNRYDCYSTLKLQQWLRDNSLGEPQSPLPARERNEKQQNKADERAEQKAVREALAEKLRAHGNTNSAARSADEIAAAMAAEALGFHAREAKKTWWEHFARLEQPIDEWEDQRGVFVVHDAKDLRGGWFREGRQRNLRRLLKLLGTPAPGSRFDRGNAFLLYEDGSGVPNFGGSPGSRAAREVAITEVQGDAIEVEEVLKGGDESYSAFPLALTPGGPLDTTSLQGAIEEWAQGIAQQLPNWPSNPAADILRRQPPRTHQGSLLSPVNGEVAPALLAALRDLDRSYIAVQGPPGTGKTHTGATVIKALVEAGWKVGVTAQSHAVIDNFLGKVVERGLDARLIAHVGGSQDVPYAVVESKEAATWIGQQPGGFLFGGTVWAFSNAKQVARNFLDLLVIDEAGQFSLANTIAASVSAKRLLLLGDPQQLPQVTQGSHPEPIDESALGWIANGQDVLPAEFGYFLERTWRMDAALTAVVSTLSYAGKLHSHPNTQARHLEGIAPGLYRVPIQHEGNTTASAEEALAVVETVRSLIGKRWSNPDEKREADPLRTSDIMIITPYNAQRARIMDALREAGYREIEVGTVDKFQGKEAVAAIVSLAASSAEEVPRGMEFLINRNRLNVAISRARWASWLVYSPALIEHLPAKPKGVAELSAFVGLVETGIVQLDHEG